MPQNVPVQTPQNIYVAKARIWARGQKWVLAIIDEHARQALEPYIGCRVVVEVFPMLLIEAKLRRDIGYLAILLPARLRQTWQMLWGGKRARRPELIVRIYIPIKEINQTEKTAKEGGA